MKSILLATVLALGEIYAAPALDHPRRMAAGAHPNQVVKAPYAKTTSIRIYLIALNDNGRSGRKIGCGDSLVPITKSIPFTRAPLTAAMQILIADHHRYYGRSGLYNALYQNTLRLKRMAIVKGRATISLTGRLNLRGECDDPRAGSQLRQTALQFRTVRSVAIFINNIPLWKLLGGKG